MTTQLGDTAPDFTADSTEGLQLSSMFPVSTPVNWRYGDDVINSPAISDEDGAVKFPQGFTTYKSYLRTTPQPDR